LVFGVTAFHLHFARPTLCWLLVGVAVTFVLGLCFAAGPAFKAKLKHEDLEPSWLIFLSITTAAAVVLGAVFGSMIYTSFMERYYEYLNLNDYNSVDVTKLRGEQLMDGARFTFVPGTSLDLRKGMGFKNVNNYCVAPITFVENGVPSELRNYDFWAVGLNCCSDDNTDTAYSRTLTDDNTYTSKPLSRNSQDFRCGQYNNTKARGALRVLEDDDRAFYRLAVQQAEERYHVKALHPLFLYWTEDPVQEMESWKEDGHKFFFIGMIVHFCFQLLLVSLGVLGFRKMGHY